MTSKIRHDCESILGASLDKLHPIGGASASHAWHFQTTEGNRYFLKCNPANSDAFPEEARGLDDLKASGFPHVPRVVHASKDYLIEDYIQPGRVAENAWDVFAQNLARLHRSKVDAYGYHFDNYLGRSPQTNPRSTNWRAFYWDHRLLAQWYVAESRGFATDELLRGFHQLESVLEKLIPDDDEKPCLIHGDLWSGNYLGGSDGNYWIIDPAPYWAHREAEFGMMLLFGGFPERFWRAYETAYPLRAGWRERNCVYQLYHLLNHLNLFGGAYYNEVLACIADCIAQAAKI